MSDYKRTASTMGLAIMLGLAGHFAITQGNAQGSGEEYEQAVLDFVTWCGPCHGRTGTGDGPLAPNLKAVPPNLTTLSQNAGGEFPADKVRLQIDGRDLPKAHGTVEMPVWGYWFNLQATAAGLLQEDQVTAEKEVNERISRLVDYLRTLQK